MKRIRRDRDHWHPPEPLPAVAVFHCRRCHAPLTRPVTRLIDPSLLSTGHAAPLVPSGNFWFMPAGGQFPGTFAMSLSEAVNVGYHSDFRRLVGCCGPSGHFGPNRVCGRCVDEVGTEQSDCLWPHSFYLDPAKVRAVNPHAGGESVGDEST